MEKVKLTAGAKGLRYGGKAIEAGNEFEATRRDARALVAIRRATYMTRDMQVAPVAPVVVEPAPVEPKPKPAAKRIPKAKPATEADPE